MTTLIGGGPMGKYEKMRISMRYWLLAKAGLSPEWLGAVKALEYGEARHTGLRKDGVTPEFQHQLSIMHYLRTLHASLMFPAETLAVAALHDVAEDAGVGFEELEALFGGRVAGGVRRVTKKHRGQVFAIEPLFEGMAECPVASVTKGADRINNLQSMLGVFTLEKQKAYCEETRKYFLPMLKAARRRFPEQELVYENIKLMLESQLALLAAAHAAAELGPVVCRN